MEELKVNRNQGKALVYHEIYPQVKSLLEGETDFYANMANLCAVLKESFDWLWVGFYVVKEQELVLGPFQGPIACTRIAFGKGVCGTAWKNKEVIIVPNVHEFPGHIACSALSNSEIVLPLIKEDKVVAVLDIDSSKLNDFDERDKEWLEKILGLV